jgi:hypothetical protein
MFYGVGASGNIQNDVNAIQITHGAKCSANDKDVRARRGSPVSLSVILPLIFPVVPAKANTGKSRQTKNHRYLSMHI